MTQPTMGDAAYVYADGSCACGEDPCPHDEIPGVYLATVKAATALLFGLAENEAPETWQEIVALWPAIDDLYRAVARVKKRAIATGMNMAHHRKIEGVD